MVSDNNMWEGRMPLRIAVGSLLIFLVLVVGASALSNSGGGTWLYNKDIRITNPGAALSDYQVLVALDNSNFQFSQAKTNGEDIRFTDAGGAELNYWIESWDNVGKRAKIWVKVPNIGGSGTTAMKMHYGNPSATSSSNGGTTFVLFDNFEGSNLDASKWTWNSGSTGTYSISNSLLRISKSNDGPAPQDVYIKSKNLPPITQTVGYKISTRVKMAGPQNVNVDYLDISNSNSNLRYTFSACRSGWCNVHEKFIDYGAQGGVFYVGPSPWSKTWLLDMAIIDSRGSISLKQENGVESYSSNDAISLSDFQSNVVIYLKLRAYNGYGEWDYVRVHKYASPEPSVSVGSGLASISVSPSPATVTVGSTQQFTATDQDGNPISVDWSSSNTLVGTVFPPTGTSTTFTANLAGTATVTATGGGVSRSAEVTVSPLLPNLIVTDITFSDLPAETKTITITATVKNNGDNSAMNVLVNFWNGDSRTIDVIPAHTSATASIQWKTPSKSSEPKKPDYYTNNICATVWYSLSENTLCKDIVVGDTGGFMYSQTFIKGSEIPDGLIVQYPQFANLYLFDSKETYLGTHVIASTNNAVNSDLAINIRNAIDDFATFSCIELQLYILYATGGASLPLCLIPEGTDIILDITARLIHDLAGDWEQQFDFSQDVEESPDGNIWIMQIVGLNENVINGQTTSDKYNLDYYYKDSNGNWIRYYSTQKDISVMMPVVSSTNKETVYFETDKGVIADISSIDPKLRPQPPEVLNLHYGLFSFNVVGIEPGSSITLTLVFPNNLPPGTSYWKYDENHNPSWYRIPGTVDENKIIITLTDGGELDEDGEVNGKIKDDGGPSIPQNLDAIPEFPTLALPILSVIGLLFVLRRWM